MALSTRQKSVVGALSAVVLAAAAFVGYRLLTGKPLDVFGLPDECPLTGLEPNDEQLVQRPMLAVKIENSAESRPQVGLDLADVIYEEEAEGGITRFIAMFQCSDAGRIGPVRSARLVDPNVLQQFGEPLFAFAGGAPKVRKLIESFKQIVDLNYVDAADAYERDPNRTPPHDVFSSTGALYAAAKGRGSPPPNDVFDYDDDVPDRAKRTRGVHAEFSPQADVVWRWNRNQEVWKRFHGTEPHTLEDGSQVAVNNVVVQMVRRIETDIVDPAGNPVFDFHVTGGGRAFVFRDGMVIRGRWEREDGDDVTRFIGDDGEDIPLSPGTTWVTLYPTDASKLDF